METNETNNLTGIQENQAAENLVENEVCEVESVEKPSESSDMSDTDKLETAEDLIAYLKTLVDAENPEKNKVDAIKVAFYKHQKLEIETARKMFVEAGNDIADFNIEPYNALETEFKSILNLWRGKRAEQIAQIEQQKQDNIEKKNRIIGELHALNEDTEDIRKSLNEVRRLQAEWKAVGPVGQEQMNDLWKRYQTEVEKFYDQLRLYNEFRDYDSKKNLEQQTALCEAAEKLLEEGDVVVAFRKLQDLHNQWRETGPVAKEIREELWTRFKNASTEINKKYQSFFERLKEIENENLTQKTAICETIEAIETDKIDSFKAWEKITAEVIELQERWKTIGFAPKKNNNKVFERYRAACDRFFQAKSAFYKDTKETLNSNLEKKRALCEKAEELKESTNWNATAAQLAQIQKEWRNIGPIPRKYADSLWKRFIGACDYFFEQKNKATSSQKNEEQQNMAAKKALIEEVKSYEGNPSGDEATNLIRDFNAKWNAIGHVPYKEKDKIYGEWREANDALTSRLGVDKTSRRLNSFQNNLEEIRQKGQGKGLQYERERLIRQYETICNEIKTSENNIGFFTTSKSSGSSLLKEMNRNIEKLKEERDLIFKKIQMIDGQE